MTEFLIKRPLGAILSF